MTGKYAGDWIHLNEVAIPGARVEDLHHAFMAEYEHIKTLLDILFMGGLNNINPGKMCLEVLTRMLQFRREVLE